MASSRGVRQENIGHVVFITAAAAIGGFLFGYDSSVINGAVRTAAPPSCRARPSPTPRSWPRAPTT